MIDRKLAAAAATCAVGSLLCFGCMARAADPPPVKSNASAAWAWASCRPDDKTCQSAAWAWSMAKPCECNGTAPDCPCKPRPTAGDLGLEWRIRTKEKDAILVKPKQCHGTFCTPEQLIGGWAEGVYREWTGKRWAEKPSEPPCQLPGTQEAAAILAAALVGIVEEIGDVPQSQTAFTAAPLSAPVAVSSGDTVVRARAIVAPVRRVLFLPFRAVRSWRANRSSARTVEVYPVETVTFAAPQTTTMRTFSWVQTGEYQLQPVTQSVPVTRYQWVPVDSATKPPPVPAKK